MKKTTLNQEIQQTLKALDNTEQVEGNPFLYTRISAKLENPATYRNYSRSLPNRIGKLLGIALLVFANLFTLKHHSAIEDSPIVGNNLSESIDADYNFAVVDIETWKTLVE